MDKLITQRIAAGEGSGQHGDMEDTLFDLAVNLAYQTFAEPSDEHVFCMYSRLLWNYQRGLGDDGACTVH